jgi:LuxR family maltose regulon positive regulatory protein
VGRLLDILGVGAAPLSKRRPRRIVGPLLDPLSERELEVLQLIAAGMSNRQIAQEMFISLGTVKTHINNIYRKLGTHSRTQAVARARDLNLV